MDNRQVAHAIRESLNATDFSEWDVAHQLAELANDFQESEINDDEVEAEVPAILESISKNLVKIIADKIVGEILTS